MVTILGLNELAVIEAAEAFVDNPDDLDKKMNLVRAVRKYRDPLRKFRFTVVIDGFANISRGRAPSVIDTEGVEVTELQLEYETPRPGDEHVRKDKG